jgi:hypothetical protein
VQTGSNGFAIAPSKPLAEMPFCISTAHHLIFDLKYSSSEEGLNAYGAVNLGDNFYIPRI